MTIANSLKVMVVEDDGIVALDIRNQLEQLGFQVGSVVATQKDAIHCAKNESPELILMDINLGEGGSGIDAANEIKNNWQIPVVFLTAYSDDKTLSKAIESSPYGYILKPYKPETLKTSLLLALRRHELESKLLHQNARLNLVTDITKIGLLEVSDDGLVVLNRHESIDDLFEGKRHIAWVDFLKLFPDCSLESMRESFEAGEIFQALVKQPQLPDDKEGDRYFNVVFSNCELHGEVVEIGAIQDITQQQKSHHNALMNDEICGQLHEGVLILDSERRVQRFNKASLRILGVDSDSVSGAHVSEFFVASRGEDSLLSGSSQEVIHQEYKAKRNKQHVDCLLTITPLKHFSDKHSFVAIIADISKLKSKERKLIDMAYKDALTGVGNRNFLEQSLKLAEKSKKPISLIFIDLDGFKSVNDSYGHDVGDVLLIETTKRLSGCLRAGDSLIRFGGDEFVVIDTDGPKHSEKLAARLLASFEEPFRIGEAELNITASIGIAAADKSLKFDEMFRHADIAMYNAKRRGKNCVETYQKDLKKEVEYRLYVEQGLFYALKSGRIVPYYQPIIDINGGLVGFEALARWLNPDTGIITPDKFIGVAEKTGLIHDLGLNIFREACLTLKTVTAMSDQRLQMHINISNVQLSKSSTIDQFLRLAKQIQVDPQCIVFEVTETTMQNKISREQVKRLRKAGFMIAIDDFGVGYSSVQELKLFSYDVVKLDKSLLDTGGDPERTKLLLENLIRLFNSIDAPVLVEGVEVQQHIDMCRDINCQFMQGNLFSAPMNAGDLAGYILEYKQIKR